MLSELNNFYDNKINGVFIEKIKIYEELKSLRLLNKKTLKLFLENIYINNCNDDINNVLSAAGRKWKIVNFSNSLDINNLCDFVIRIDDSFFIPSFMKNNIKNFDDDAIKKIIIYKTTKTNFVIYYNNIFHVIKSKNTIIIFDIEIFKQVMFFSNFNFYFVYQSNTYLNNDFIKIN